LTYAFEELLFSLIPMGTHRIPAGSIVSANKSAVHGLIMMKRLHVLGLFLASIMMGPAGELKPIPLPKPEFVGGKSLMEAISLRKSTREFGPDRLALKTLGEILWAGFGINRPNDARRTAPSAMNSQEVDLYLALPEALYVYEPKEHRLAPVLEGDFRGQTGQTFSKDAAAVIIYVADLSRLSKAKPETRLFYAGIDTGAISQNVYLYCASRDLATVVYDLNREPLAKAMKLNPSQQIILAQAVGYPKTILPDGEKNQQK